VLGFPCCPQKTRSIEHFPFSRLLADPHPCHSARAQTRPHLGATAQTPCRGCWGSGAPAWRTVGAPVWVSRARELILWYPHTCKWSSLSSCPAPPTRIPGGDGLFRTRWDPWGRGSLLGCGVRASWAPPTPQVAAPALHANPPPYRTPCPGVLVVNTRSTRTGARQRVQCCVPILCAWRRCGVRGRRVAVSFRLCGRVSVCSDRVLFAKDGAFPTAQRLGHFGVDDVRVLVWLGGMVGTVGVVSNLPSFPLHQYRFGPPAPFPCSTPIPGLSKVASTRSRVWVGWPTVLWPAWKAPRAFWASVMKIQVPSRGHVCGARNPRHN